MTEQAFNPSATLALYADGPAQLEAVLSGLSEVDLDLAQTGDSWTMRQIVHHLADGDDIWKTCIKAALGNGEGLFSLSGIGINHKRHGRRTGIMPGGVLSIPGALAPQPPAHCRIDWTDPNAWEKSIRIKWPDGEEERITIGEVLEMQASHVVGHIHDIQMIRGRLKSGSTALPAKNTGRQRTPLKRI